jgi:hypothetical protein
MAEEKKFDEEFKVCPFNTSLEVSQYGRVRDNNGNILKQTIFKGYLIVEDLSDNNPLERVHRLVALTWLSENYEKGKGMVVHHKDRNGFNNRVDNLEWKTSEQHTIDHGWRGVDENGVWYDGMK